GGNPLACLVQGVAVGVVAGGRLAGAAALAALALAPQSLDALALGGDREPAVAACVAAQAGNGRVYGVEPSAGQLAWVAQDPLRRGRELGLGYAALDDRRQMVRTFAPLRSRALARHLEGADRGPAGRWWLDSASAGRIVATHPIAGFPELHRAGELRVLGNPQAWPEAFVARALPREGEQRTLAGEVLAEEGGGGSRAWHLRADESGGVLVWLSTPDEGWRVTVDGRPAVAQRGDGILQGVPLPAGEHRVEARYRPPGLVAGAGLSLLCAGILLVLTWRRAGPAQPRAPKAAAASR
ncbi:MAG: YfhO family protein, partial [Acidobacteriota bacterium]